MNDYDHLSDKSLESARQNCAGLSGLIEGISYADPREATVLADELFDIEEEQLRRANKRGDFCR